MTPLKVLALATGRAEAAALATAVRAAEPRARIVLVHTERQVREALAHTAIDCLVARVPRGPALTDRVAELRTAAPEVALVVLTCRADDHSALDALRNGAEECRSLAGLDPADLSQAMRLAIERHRAQADLRHLALTDQLTGVFNRTLFLDRVAHALARAQRRPTGVAVLFIDLDHFKPINDRYGHRAGDRALVSFARRICSVVRPSDTFARLGGDEFGMLCEGLGFDEEAERIAERIVATARAPMFVARRRLSISASVGIAHGRPGLDAHDMLHAADEAMYQAKASHAGIAVAGRGPGTLHALGNA